MFATLFLQALAALSTAPSASVYNGAQHALAVHVPMAVAEATIDGELDDPAWRGAAVLTGFSMYQPVDGRPAPDSMEVLVWRSATALYVGIRAFEPHAPVRATLADRDKIPGDDNVQIFLDTFDDHRRAFVFAVNPLGAQSDGIRSEGSGAELAARLLSHMDDTSSVIAAPYLHSNTTDPDVPPRSGYLLGLCVAQAMGRKRSLAALARLDAASVREEMSVILHELAESPSRERSPSPETRQQSPE